MERLSLNKFDTCFFERYAKTSLVDLLGEKYAGLLNADRPDLQDSRGEIGIEVTRAMEEDKLVALSLVNDIAGKQVTCVSDEDMALIRDHGYSYGINGRFLGALEYEYWSLAWPLRRILESKVRKVADGFYGHFNEFGLYVFSKDDLSLDEVHLAMRFVVDLQSDNALRYSYLYLLHETSFFLCDLSTGTYKTYELTPLQCRRYYNESIN